MTSSFSDIIEEARLSARALLDYGENFFNPTIRLGVTGLSRAGKTVFITALVMVCRAAAGFRFLNPSPAVASPARSLPRSRTTRYRGSTMNITSKR